MNLYDMFAIDRFFSFHLDIRWFPAELFKRETRSWARAWIGQRNLHLVDVFSASQGLKRLILSQFVFLAILTVPARGVKQKISFSQATRKAWSRAGYASVAYDVKLSSAHDLTSRRGFYCLLDMLFSHLSWNVLVILKLEVNPMSTIL